MTRGRVGVRRLTMAMIASAVGVAVAVPRTIEAQDATPPERSLPFGTIGLELIDHSIDVAEGGDLVLTYELVGQLADAELLLIDQPDDPDESSTNDAGENAAAEGDDPAPGGPDDEDEVDAPEPAPVPISVDVIVDDRLDEVQDLIGRLGPNATPGVFPTPIDGIQIADVRPFVTVADDGTTVLRLTVGTDTAPSQADRLRIDEPGLHPLLVSLRIDGEVVARHGTVLHRVDARSDIATVNLGAIAAVEEPATLLDEDELEPLVEDAAQIADHADRSDLPMWISIPPNVIERLSDEVGPDELGAAFADDVVQGLPATPFDISSAVAVARGDAFLRQLTIGEEQLQTALPGVPIGRDLWFVDRPISTNAATLLRTLGVRALVMTPGLASTTLDRPPESFSLDRSLRIELADGSELPVLLVDEADDRYGGVAAEAALARGTLTDWAIDHLTRLRLELEASTDGALDRLDLRAGRGHLLSGADMGVLDDRLLNELVRLDDRTRIHDVVSASTLAAVVSPDPDVPVLRLPDEAGPSLAGRLDSIDSAREQLDDAASMLADDDPRIDEWAELLDSLVSTAITDEQADERLTAVRSQAAALSSAIVAPEPFTITLTSRRGLVPISVGNTADEELRVRLSLSSPRLRFPDGEPELVLAPGTSTEIEIPVEALTNGTTSVQVQVVTPSGAELTDPVRVSTRVQALSGVAQLATGTLLLLLLTWWLTHWRARRDERAAASG